MYISHDLRPPQCTNEDISTQFFAMGIYMVKDLKVRRLDAEKFIARCRNYLQEFSLGR